MRLEQISVLKRDGRVKSFDEKRIFTAIKNAFDDVYLNDFLCL